MDLRRVAPPAILALCLACNPATRTPGNQLIGTYNFTATQVGGSFLSVVDAGFTFQATLSLNTARAANGFYQAYVTVNNLSRDAGFDGQYLTSLASAPRQFDSCGPGCGEQVQVAETLTVALLSATQLAAAGGVCPQNPLDGGVPPPGGTIRAPSFTGVHYDAPKACGTITDVFYPAAACTCDAGTAIFGLMGDLLQ